MKLNKQKNAIFASGGIAIALQLLLSSSLMAAPSGGSIAVGTVDAPGSINTPDAQGNTIITQTSNTLRIDWDDFSIDPNTRVEFIQNPEMLAINNVTGNNVSQILGELRANGNVAIFNTNGIIFGANSAVNVGGLIASSLPWQENIVLDGSSITNGTFEFLTDVSDNTGEIILDGQITANSGSIAVLGHSVQNNGVITASVGTVDLAAGSAGTIAFNGNNLIRFQTTVTQASETDNGNSDGSAVSTTNGSSITASNIIITAKAASSVFDTAINTDGLLRAVRIDGNGGDITLSGEGAPVVAGINSEIDASASSDSGSGGNVVITSASDDILQDGTIAARTVSITTQDGGNFSQTFNGNIQADEAIVINVENPDTTLNDINRLENGGLEPNDPFNSPDTFNPSETIVILNGNVTVVPPIDPVDPVDPVDPTDPTDPTDPPVVVNPPVVNPPEVVNPPVETEVFAINNNRVNENSAAIATIKDRVDSATIVSLGLYEVEGSGIKLPEDQEEF